MNPPAYYEEIRRKAASRWDQLERDPELAAPWHQLFKQVQSPRHVLSELLQNADDAGATEASVAIEQNEFVFTHNGDDFQEQHFSSLCRFGYSNKRALHTIGFRGIGFKSTFSIGNEVRLQTPSLSVAFHKRRFTEPYWVECRPQHPSTTTITVKIDDKFRKAELEKNLNHWLESPTSLLFFRSLRKFQIGNRKVAWTSMKEGPVPNSEWMVSSSVGEKPVLLVCSELEAFPPQAIEEIRQERMLSDAEDSILPPCKIEIVLGLEGRLFVVLPTGVKVFLPFACNAPFVQDPARVKIKDPETSPTNRWLLQRTGALAAQTMLSWLRRGDLTVAERAAAYQLLMAWEETDNSIEGSCTTIISNTFASKLKNAQLLITDTGNLVRSQECITIPQWLRDVWRPEQIATIFDELHRPLFANEATRASKQILIKKGFLPELSTQRILEILRDNHLPCPESWRQLLCLWHAIGPSVNQFVHSWQSSWKTVCIVPVQGHDCLFSATEVVRLGEKKLLHSEDDWRFLSEMILVLNPSWSKFLAEERRLAETAADASMSSQLQTAEQVLQVIGLANSSDANKVISKAAAAFFTKKELEIADCVRLAQIAAALQAKLDKQFHFVTQNRKLKSCTSTCPLVFDAQSGLESLLSETWCSEHILHSTYSDNYSSCTPTDWKTWIDYGHSGLFTFVPIELMEDDIDGRHDLGSFLYERGVSSFPKYHYKTDTFIVKDWDFAEEHWKKWEQLSRTDSSIWAKLLARVFAQPSSFWDNCLNANLYQVATTGTQRLLDVRGLLPSWIYKLRSKACIQDTWGHFREPAEVLRRTSETESLLDVEPFVRAEHDIESLRPLLARLGVRDKPSSPRRLVERLQALATVANPPLYEVQKWCHRIDAMLPRCSTEEFHHLKSLFLDQRLILTSDCKWARADEVFLSSDESLVFGSATIHNDIRNLTMWQKLGVADRPTVEAVMVWLTKLPRGERLAPDELRRTKELLPRHSQQIWNECKCWLNLEGEWIGVDQLKYSLSMQSLSAWSHLFPAVKRQVADLTRLPAELIHQNPFTSLPSLASRLEERVHSNRVTVQSGRLKDWMTALGHGLSRVVTDIEEKTQQIRSQGRRLADTAWQTTNVLETVPYLDGVPAGTARPNEVLWEGNILFVEDRPITKMVRHVVRELARPFNDPDVEDAIKFCIERNTEQVEEYLEQNFALAPRTMINTQTEPEERLNTSQLDNAEADEPDGKVESAGVPVIENATDSEMPVPVVEIPVLASESNGTQHPTSESNHIRAEPRQKQLSLMERYAHGRGFRRDGSQDRFFHPDGRWIQKSHGMTFPWEMYSAGGDLINCYIVRDHCMLSEPLPIAAEVWDALRRKSGTHAIITANRDGTPLANSGEQLLGMVEAGTLILYPAAYRLGVKTQE